MATMRERMLAGQPYRADDAELVALAARAATLARRFNTWPVDDPAGARAVLAELLGSLGTGAVIRPPLEVDYGRHLHVGDGTFVNVGAIVLDVAEVRLGVRCQVGPRVSLLTATHPLDAVARASGWESAAPITVGDDVWLGGGATVLPGVTIGAGTVVGAGAVVTRDLPAGVVAHGVPARVVRELDATDATDDPDGLGDPRGPDDPDVPPTR